MGRCYEFGVEIQAGCEHAMVVEAAGGTCECRTCGARCGGRFSGCLDVLASPGRVPPAAPAWAVPGSAQGAPRPDPPPTSRRRRTGPAAGSRPNGAPATGPAPPPVPVNGQRADDQSGPGVQDQPALHAELGEIRQLLSSLAAEVGAEGVASLLKVVAGLRNDLADRDAATTSALAAAAERHDELAAGLAALAAAVQELAATVQDRTGPMLEALTALDARMAATEERAARAPLRRVLDRLG